MTVSYVSVRGHDLAVVGHTKQFHTIYPVAVMINFIVNPWLQ